MPTLTVLRRRQLRSTGCLPMQQKKRRGSEEGGEERARSGLVPDQCPIVVYLVGRSRPPILSHRSV